jgi:hypothetical protein
LLIYAQEQEQQSREKRSPPACNALPGKGMQLFSGNSGGVGRMVASQHPEDPKVKLINLYYLCPMSSKRNTQKAQSQHPEGPHIITINLDEWTTQTQKARTYLKADSTQGVSIEYINKLISKGKLRAWNIPELGIKLVEK